MPQITISHRYNFSQLASIEVTDSPTFFKDVLQLALDQQMELAYADCQLQELNGLQARDGQLRGVGFGQSSLRGADFSGVDLRVTDFFGCDLTGANFTGALMSLETSFAESTLTGVIGF